MSDYFQGNFPSSMAVTNSAETARMDANDLSGTIVESIAQAAWDRKGGDILLLKVGDVSYLADYFAIVTGYSKAQVRAIADAIEEKVETQWHRRPLRTAGKAEGTWVLQDYGEVIVHIMMPNEREFYNLEAFWGHAERIEFETSD